MRLRDNIEPKMETAEALYSPILALIKQIETNYDNGDIEGMQEGINEINRLAPKNK